VKGRGIRRGQRGAVTENREGKNGGGLQRVTISFWEEDQARRSLWLYVLKGEKREEVEDCSLENLLAA